MKLDIFFPQGWGGIKLVRRWKFLISSRHRAVILNNPFRGGEGTMKLTVHGLCFPEAFYLGLLLLLFFPRHGRRSNSTSRNSWPLSNADTQFAYLISIYSIRLYIMARKRRKRKRDILLIRKSLRFVNEELFFSLYYFLWSIKLG